MKEEKNWHYTVYETGKSDSVINSVVVWNCKICVVLKFLHYTDDYTGRVDFAEIPNRVFAENVRIAISQKIDITRFT